MFTSNKYGFGQDPLSIHKYITLNLLPLRDARLHRQESGIAHLLKEYTEKHHLRKKLPKIPPTKDEYERLLGGLSRLCHKSRIWDGKKLRTRA